MQRLSNSQFKNFKKQKHENRFFFFFYNKKIIKAIDKAKIRLNANVNFETAIELLLLTIKE